MTLAVLCVLGMFANGTWAYMQDTETSATNTFTIGNLDLVSVVSGSYTGGPVSLYVVTPGSNGVNGKVKFEVMAPDQSGYIRWVLRNNGSLGGTLSVAISGNFTDGPAAVEPESLYAANNSGGNGDLGQYLMVTLQKGTGSSESAAVAALSTGYINPGHNSTDSTPFALSLLGGLWNGDTTSMSAGSGSSAFVVYQFNWYLTSSALGGLYTSINIIQGDTVQLDLIYTLGQ
ncbi:hypothetical protein CVH13_00229 [Dehalococcoides mccartyi]|uniref:DUF4430 domain-containing protein n=1 Tax=Dehalococcoides mccartyi TaxID=61435 RepID=A0A2J1E050_9CHLR|nr:hypothetical protein CVH13_00229 [Dehalococcoides mccartyi]